MELQREENDHDENEKEKKDNDEDPQEILKGLLVGCLNQFARRMNWNQWTARGQILSLSIETPRD